MNFASELKALLSRTEVKHAAIAEAVQYDGSYISKWLSGRIAPSERYIDRIAAQIAGCVVVQSSASSIAALCEAYDADVEELEAAITERLLAAYRGDNRSVQEISFQADAMLLPLVKSIPWNGQTVAVVDLFSMEHESRLLLAGIRHGHFIDRNLPALKWVVDLDKLNDPVYDPIFLVHMLTAHSSARIGLFHHPFAAEKLLYADDRQFISAILSDASHCLAVTKQENPAVAAQLKHSLNGFCTQETMLVQHIDSLFDEHLYMQSLLSASHRWLTGHFTEQMIPADLFAALTSPEDHEMLPRIGALLQKTEPQLLVYRSAFTKMMIHGELDFFNRKILLTPEQQMACFRHVRDMAERGCVRIVDGGFSTDFQYITDPCVFLSDTVAYLRLENGRYANNLLNITDRRLKTVYQDFFGLVWQENPMVIREKAEVLRLIDACVAQLQAMA